MVKEICTNRISRSKIIEQSALDHQKIHGLSARIHHSLSSCARRGPRLSINQRLSGMGLPLFAFILG